VTLDATTYIPFSVPYDIEPNAYTLRADVTENGVYQASFYSQPFYFNTNYWENNDINISADLN